GGSCGRHGAPASPIGRERGLAVRGRSVVPAGLLAFDRPPADVVAVEFAMPGNAGHRLVGMPLRLADRRAERAHAQHATAGGDDLAIDHPGARMEDLAVADL